MKKKARRVYEPLERVIVTRDQIARIGYVASDLKGNTGIYGEGVWQIRVAYYLEDAQEHRSKLISYDYVLPYTDEVWAAFLRLEKMRLNVGSLFEELRKGKIPDELQPVKQGFLFDAQNT